MIWFLLEHLVYFCNISSGFLTAGLSSNIEDSKIARDVWVVIPKNSAIWYKNRDFSRETRKFAVLQGKKDNVTFRDFAHTTISRINFCSLWILVIFEAYVYLNGIMFLWLLYRLEFQSNTCDIFCVNYVLRCLKMLNIKMFRSCLNRKYFHVTKRFQISCQKNGNVKRSMTYESVSQFHNSRGF